MRWLEKKLGRFAVPHLTMAYVIMIAAVSGLNLATGAFAGPLSLQTALEDNLWQIALFPFRLASGAPATGEDMTSGLYAWFILFMILALFWVFGSAVETVLGDFQYNAYVVLGVLSCLAGSYFMPMGCEYILLGIFLAYAHLFPNQVFLLMFIIPIKVRYIAIGAAILVFYPMVSLAIKAGSVLPLIPALLSVVNYLLFFATGYFKRLFHRRVMPGVASPQRVSATRPAAIHRCFVCGKTELDDPRLEFRFCVDCSDHEYCTDHLHNHVHQ